MKRQITLWDRVSRKRRIAKDKSRRRRKGKEEYSESYFWWDFQFPLSACTYLLALGGLRSVTFTLITILNTKPSHFQCAALEQPLKEITLTVISGPLKAFEYEYDHSFQNKLNAVKIEQLKRQRVLAAAFFCRRNLGREAMLGAVDLPGCGWRLLPFACSLLAWQKNLSEQTRAPQGLVRTVPGSAWPLPGSGYRQAKNLWFAIVYLSRDLVLLSCCLESLLLCHIASLAQNLTPTSLLLASGQY